MRQHPTEDRGTTPELHIIMGNCMLLHPISSHHRGFSHIRICLLHNVVGPDEARGFRMECKEEEQKLPEPSVHDCSKCRLLSRCRQGVFGVLQGVASYFVYGLLRENGVVAGFRSFVIGGERRLPEWTENWVYGGTQFGGLWT